MQIITTHKGADFDAAASVLAAKILYPEAVAVMPKRLTDNLVDTVVNESPRGKPQSIKN